MKKLLLFAAVATLTASCVDKDFDLKDADWEDVQIGNDDSEFRLPLANISVKGDAIGGTYDSLENIFGEADEWIPLSDKYAAVSLTQLSDPSGNYLNTLVDDLFAELQTNDQRRAAVARRIGTQYKSSVSVPAELAAQGVSLEDYINVYLTVPQYSDRIKTSVHDLAAAHLESMTTCIDQISQSLAAFKIGGDVTDALADNAKDMKVYGTVTTSLPIDCNGNFSLSPKEEKENENEEKEAKEDYKPFFSANLNLGYMKTENIDAPIDGDGLRGLTKAMTLTVTFEPTTYYPRKTLPGSNDNAVEMVLKLYKKGGLSFSGDENK